MGQMASPDVGRVVADLGKIVSEKYVSTTLFERIKSSLDTFPYEAERETLPYAVVMPESKGEIREIVTYANSTKIPIFVRGSGTSFTGASRYHVPGIVLSTRRLNRVEIFEDYGFFECGHPPLFILGLRRHADGGCRNGFYDSSGN